MPPHMANSWTDIHMMLATDGPRVRYCTADLSATHCECFTPGSVRFGLTTAASTSGDAAGAGGSARACTITSKALS